MPVLVTCKFDGDPIKRKVFHVHNTSIFSILSIWEKFRLSRASNSKANNPISKIKLVRDFMPVLLICKFKEDPISQVDFIPDFMSVLVTCKFKEDPIKIEGLRAITAFYPL